MAKIPFALRESSGQPVTGAELDAQLVQIDDIGVKTPAIDANGEITELAKGAGAATANDVLHADGTWGPVAAPAPIDVNAVHKSDINTLVPGIDANGELAQLPSGAGIAVPTDILHADGTWGPETAGGGGGPAPVPAWINLTLLSGWAHLVSSTAWNSDPLPVPAYYKDVNTSLVLVKGSISGGTVGIIANLPVGCRPLETVLIPCRSWLGQGIGALRIRPNGDIMTEAGISSGGTFFNFSFRAEQ